MPKNNNGISRRNFIKGLGGGIAGTATLASAMSLPLAPQGGPHGSTVFGPGEIRISFKLNGKGMDLTVEPRTTLLDALRDQLGFTGTKRVCNRGQCGACTVVFNGRTVYACALFAMDADGAEIETIEGLAKGDELHPVQRAFIKHDAMQCGFCTPGFIVSSVALLRENPSPDLEEIKEGVSGNLCRCGTYPNIFQAVTDAAQTMKKGG